MVDIHIIARHKHQNPITLWDVKTVEDNLLLGTLEEVECESAVFRGVTEFLFTEVFQTVTRRYISFDEAKKDIYRMYNPEFLN